MTTADVVVDGKAAVMFRNLPMGGVLVSLSVMNGMKWN